MFGTVLGNCLQAPLCHNQILNKLSPPEKASVDAFTEYCALFTCLMIQDVTEKDFPCGEIKEEKGIQVESLSTEPILL